MKNLMTILPSFHQLRMEKKSSVDDDESSSESGD
jgi:hypothetical protein